MDSKLLYNKDMKKVKPDLEKKSGKYWMERQKGKKKTEAALAVGLNPKNIAHVEQTENFLALEKSSFKEEILKHILMPEIAREHARLITEAKEDSTKLAAIKLAYDKIEPEGAIADNSQKVVVILK